MESWWPRSSNARSQMGINLGFSSGCFNFDGSGFGRCRFWGLRACNPSFEAGSNLEPGIGKYSTFFFFIFPLSFLSTQFGELTKMVEKYFGIFRQKWKGNYSSNFRMFRIGAICRGYYRKIFAISFFYFSSPFLSARFGEWRNDREVFYNFQTCAEMKG